jgi:hypothetical protein
VVATLCVPRPVCVRSSAGCSSLVICDYVVLSC